MNQILFMVCVLEAAGRIELPLGMEVNPKPFCQVQVFPCGQSPCSLAVLLNPRNGYVLVAAFEPAQPYLGIGLFS